MRHCKSEPFLSDDDSITENKDMNKIISVVFMSIIFRLQNTECNINSFKRLKIIWILSIYKIIRANDLKFVCIWQFLKFNCFTQYNFFP